MSKNKTTGKVLGVVTLVVLVLAFAAGVIILSGKPKSERSFESNKEDTLDATLVQMAREINQTLPLMLDTETRLDSTIGSNRKVRYNFTLVNYAAEELNGSALAQAMQPRLIDVVCTTKEMAVYVDNNIPVTYAYYGKNGKKVTSITVHASNCRNGSQQSGEDKK